MLDRSGTGDDFMSPAFQETLRDSPLVLNSEGAFSLIFLACFMGDESVRRRRKEREEERSKRSKERERNDKLRPISFSNRN